MVSRDVRITMSLTETTYAQVVERAFTAEGAGEEIYYETAARFESRRAAQAAMGSQRGGGLNYPKRKGFNMSNSMADKKQKSNFDHCQGRSKN